MFQQFFAGHSLLDLPVLAMILFIATFLVVVVKVLRQGGDDPQLEAMSKLPFDEDQG